MSKDIPWLKRIKSGIKTIESRWYNQKRKPWHAIDVGDCVFFKNTGESVSMVARVTRVLFYADLSHSQVKGLLSKYGDQLGLLKAEQVAFFQKVALRKFCILIFLEQVVEIVPFTITKKGFGSMSAWITTPDLYQLKKL